MKDSASAYCAALTRQWHMKQGIPIDSLWSQMKQLQSIKPAISAVGPKKIALKIWGRSCQLSSNLSTKAC